MKYVAENFVDYSIIETAKKYGFVIDVIFCRDCPYFEPNGIQTDPAITRGWCRYYSDEDTSDGNFPHYFRTDSENFCNGDNLTERKI